MSGNRHTWDGTLSKIWVHSSPMCCYVYFQKEKPSCPLQLSVKLQWLCLTASATLEYLPSYASPQRHYTYKLQTHGLGWTSCAQHCIFQTKMGKRLH